MAMTARLWSISALAVELGMDRRTVGKRLARVPPDGRLNGSPAWRLATALEALCPDPVSAARRRARRAGCPHGANAGCRAGRFAV